MFLIVYSILKLFLSLLEWSLSEEVKLQDRVFLIISVADAGPDSRLAAWRFFKVSILADIVSYSSFGYIMVDSIADTGPNSRLAAWEKVPVGTVSILNKGTDMYK